jgi:hypothetical protein
MRMRDLASVLAKREGKKHEATVGDVREVLSLLCDVLAEEQAADSAATLITVAREVKKRADRLRRRAKRQAAKR